MQSLDQTAVYWRGHIVPFGEAQLSIASAPMLYGLSTYTVFPVFWNEVEGKLFMFRLPDHFRRLQNSAKILAFDDFLAKWDYGKFEQVMRELLVRNGTKADALVRVTVFVDAVMGGTRMHGLPHELAAFVYPVAPLLPESGAKLCVSSWRRTPDNAIPARAKVNGSYVNAALMKNEAVLSGFDDAVALDEAGHVTESTVSNIFLVRDGRLVTPGASADLLEGITRDTVFHLAEDLGIAHEQRSIDRSELYLADEIFLSGSSMRIAPVIAVDNRPTGDGQPGPLTTRLLAAYEAAGHGRTESRQPWLTEV